MKIARGLRNEVRLLGIRPELVIGLLCVDGAFARAGFACVITSCVDGAHQRQSLHYAGCAADLRISHVPKEKLPAILEDARGALGVDFDLVAESDHWHLEFQPKEAL